MASVLIYLLTLYLAVSVLIANNFAAGSLWNLYLGFMVGRPVLVLVFVFF